MANDPSALLPTPEELAFQAADFSAPAEARDHAFRALEPLVRQAARASARAINADERLREDLHDECLGHIAEKLPHYRPERGPFRVWVHQVLHNFGCDLRRRRRRLREVSLSKEVVGRPDTGSRLTAAVVPEEGAAADLERRFAALRLQLDTCVWPPSRRVDYFAVLLARLRLELADHYRASREGVLPAQEAAERVAVWLPWRNDEEARRFRPDLPTLSDLWRELAPKLGERLGLAEVVAVVNACPPPGTRLSYDTLNQWMFRARKLAHESIGDDAWYAHGFAHLLGLSGRESVS